MYATEYSSRVADSSVSDMEGALIRLILTGHQPSRSAPPVPHNSYTCNVNRSGLRRLCARPGIRRRMNGNGLKNVTFQFENVICASDVRVLLFAPVLTDVLSVL